MANTYKILYIEDDQNSRFLLKKILTDKGYQMLEAEDGLSGLEIAEKEKVDLILLDINMSGMNGFEIATRIKSIDLCRETPLVAITANLKNNTKDMALISGCDGYLNKPIDINIIVDQINEYLCGKKESLEPDKYPVLMREYILQLVSHLEKEIKELKRANTDLKEIDKLKSDFISLASHELRTPLVTIIGYTGLLLSLRMGNIPDEQLKLLKIIERNAKRLEKIVKDMFVVSLLENKIPFMELRSINPIKIVRSVLEDLSINFEQRELKNTLKIEGDIPFIDCDEDKISQVINNIIKNAIKYTENGGLIDITIRYPSQKIIEKHGLDPNLYIEILIEDNGIGIPDDKKFKIFEKFTELSNIEHHHTSENDFMGGGIGLGLSISYGIVEKHNGYLWAEKREEKGTRLVIILPLKNTNNLAFIDNTSQDYKKDVQSHN